MELDFFFTSLIKEQMKKVDKSVNTWKDFVFFFSLCCLKKQQHENVFPRWIFLAAVARDRVRDEIACQGPDFAVIR